MPDSGELYVRLLAMGLGPEVVANMTPRQQLMYFFGNEDDGGVTTCGTMEEAQELVARLERMRR